MEIHSCRQFEIQQKEDLTGSQVWGHDEIISKYVELVKKILGPDHSMQQCLKNNQRKASAKNVQRG